MSTKKQLIATVEVLHAYFQQLFRVGKGEVKIVGQIHPKGLYKNKAIDLAVTIKPGKKYSQTEVMGNWVSASTTDPNQAKEEKKQLHPDTVYGALAYLMFQQKIPGGGLGYYQMRTEANSMIFGQSLAAASHNPTYSLPDGPFGKHWLWTTYEDSKWFQGILNIGSAKNQNIKISPQGIEEVEFSDINSDWYKAAYGKNVKTINRWMRAGIMPSHVVDKYDQLKKTSTGGKWAWIPNVQTAYMEIGNVE